MTNPLVPKTSGTLYGSGPKTSGTSVPATSVYFTPDDANRVESLLEDIINDGTVVLSTSLGSISSSLSSTIGAVSSSFSSTIGAVSSAFSATVGSVSSAFSASLSASGAAFALLSGNLDASATLWNAVLPAPAIAALSANLSVLSGNLNSSASLWNGPLSSGTAAPMYLYLTEVSVSSSRVWRLFVSGGALQAEQAP